MSGGEDFLRRWSRRKRHEATRPEPESEIAAVTPPPASDNPPAETETEEEILARLGLPDPETLSQGDDFSAFMQAAVPEALRRRALRRLWRSNPVLANLDGLNDYDDDYTGGALPSGTLGTLYRVGRGFLDAPADAGTDPGAPAITPQRSASDAENSPAPCEDLQEVAEFPEVDADAPDMQENAPSAPQRRMIFTFPNQ